jgi:hypothetical protein
MGYNRSEIEYGVNKFDFFNATFEIGSLLMGDFSILDSTLEGTLLSSIKFIPKASVATATVTRHVLFAAGELTGTTAFGMGDVAKPTYGAMFSFGRTIAATDAWTGTDTALDVRMLNKIANNAAYAMQGAYIKAKNYSTGTVGVMRGLFVECVADGTETSSVALKLGSDGSAITHAIDMDDCVVTNGADIKLSSGLTIGSGSAAPTHVAPAGSLYIRTGQTDENAMLYLCTVADGTWVLLNTVTA